MKIIEALKAQKKINDKITRNNVLIKNYASKLNTEKPQFESEKQQEEEVSKLIQANISHVNHFLYLKRCIDYTNIVTKVTICDKTFTITDLLNLKRTGIRLILDTYRSLNDDATTRRALSAKSATVENVTVDKMYDEKAKNEALNNWQTIYDEIDGKLEIINAVTDLIEPDKDKEHNSTATDQNLPYDQIIL